MNIQNDLLQENRKLNRISIQRYDKSLSRGYNPITSQKLSTMEQFYSNSRIKKPISVWEKLLIPGSEIETGKNEIPPSHTRYDISQNHGNNLDWDIDEKRNIPQEEKKNHTSGMQSSKSLTQLTKPSSPSAPYTLNKNNSTPLLRPMTIATERVPLPPSSAATATSSSRAKYTVPSLDLTKTSMSVRTGGIGEY